MRVLASPNWSFGRDRRLLSDCRDVLADLGLTIHYAESDIDQNRTVTAFSGEQERVESAVLALCDRILPVIDLNRHAGVYPRIGGLDVCPLIALEVPKTRLRAQKLKEWAESLGSTIAERFEIPVFLYEKSERGRSESELHNLRKGGFGGLLDLELRPDFGPTSAHPNLGVTYLGFRDFMMIVNVNLSLPDPTVAKRIAQRVRELRSEGDPRMLGVRALGLPLASRDLSQVSLKFTLPDLTPIDPVLEYVALVADSMGIDVAYDELVGVIRDSDLPTATRLHPRPEQVVTVEVRV
jgi:glutamate formiminotransferase